MDLQIYGKNLSMMSDGDLMVKIDYNLNYECFASSINCTFKHYCSIYYDIERFFGSFARKVLSIRSNISTSQLRCQFLP
jgi:hypothetical protein